MLHIPLPLFLGIISFANAYLALSSYARCLTSFVSLAGTNEEHDMHFHRVSRYEYALVRAANLCMRRDRAWPVQSAVGVPLGNPSSSMGHTSSGAV